jgi:ribosome biogenesis GTPase
MGMAASALPKPSGKSPLESADARPRAHPVNTPPAALRAIGWPWAGAVGDAEWAALMAAHPAAAPARVVEQHRTGYLVAMAPGEAEAVESLPDWQRPRCPPASRAAVGDWVLVESGRIVAMLPRRSLIKRAAAGEHYAQQLIAANIDTAFVVCGLDRDFNPRRIERYLLLVRGGGVGAVVVLTKADHDDADAGAALEALSASLEGADAVAVDARDAAALDVLAPWLGPGRTVVLVGSSGAGKSTLANTLLGHARMRTGEVRATDDRGRHTTTHRALLPLPSGACLIDTPGMRELKPTGEEDIAENFSDIDALAEACRFRDCSHDAEPGCAVCAAVEAGTLDGGRLANFFKLRDEHAAAARQLEERRRNPQPATGSRRRR